MYADERRRSLWARVKAGDVNQAGATVAQQQQLSTSSAVRPVPNTVRAGALAQQQQQPLATGGGAAPQPRPAGGMLQMGAPAAGSGGPPKMGAPGMGKVGAAKKDYGPGGKWVYDRAHSMMKDMKERYGTKEGERIAYATATQQAHKVGKSPKRHRTPTGVRVAKAKYDKPLREYKKTASFRELAVRAMTKRAQKATRIMGLLAKAGPRGRPSLSAFSAPPTVGRSAHAAVRGGRQARYVNLVHPRPSTGYGHGGGVISAAPVREIPSKVP